VSTTDDVIRMLVDRIENLERFVSRQSVKMNNMFREGEVMSVNPTNGTGVVNAQGIETPESPWMQQAGAINDWVPLSVGQRVLYVAPGGDLGRGFIIPGGFSDANPQPHNQLAEARRKIGNCEVTQSSSGLLIKAGGTTYEFAAGGFTQIGGSQRHNDKNVGDSHTHGGVFSGPSNTSVPNP